LVSAHARYAIDGWPRRAVGRWEWNTYEHSDNDPLHVAINAKLAAVVEASPQRRLGTMSGWRCGPESTEEERLAVYQAVRTPAACCGGRLLPGLWQIDAIASQDAKSASATLDEKMKAVEEAPVWKKASVWAAWGKAPEGIRKRLHLPVPSCVGRDLRRET